MFLEWDDADQDKALAWMVEDADRCSGCGTQSYEEPTSSIGEITCLVCSKLELRRADVFETPHPKKPGKKFVVRRDDGT